MSIAKTDQALVVLNVPPSLEEAVVDWLLARHNSSGFTSQAVHGHSASHKDLTPAEQVSGRRGRLQFEVQMARASVDEFLNSASIKFGKADGRYWVLPVIVAGHLDVIEESLND